MSFATLLKTAVARYAMVHSNNILHLYVTNSNEGTILLVYHMIDLYVIPSW